MSLVSEINSLATKCAQQDEALARRINDINLGSMPDATTSTKGAVLLESSLSGSSGIVPDSSAVKAYIDSKSSFTHNIFEPSAALSGTSIDVSTASVFAKTISADTTFTITGVTSNLSATFSLILTNGGSATITWPASVKWSGGTPPTLTTSGIDVLTFLTGDGGTTWYGVASSVGAA